jgi:putative component of membrane protein insertase Oxa1/YidC/SpoIIIJ protein YidD
LIEIKEHDFPTCSSYLVRTSFKAANSAAFLFAKSASVPRDIRCDPPEADMATRGSDTPFGGIVN